MTESITAADNNVTPEIFCVNSTALEDRIVGYGTITLMCLGVILNSVLFFAVVFHPRMRQMVNAFVAHQCLIGIARCIICTFFSKAYLANEEPLYCDKLGGLYIVLISAEVFNLLAMVCSEAYFFGESNIGKDPKGSFCCICIGLFLVYLGSVILHLGPTIIAGGIKYQTQIGVVLSTKSCHFLDTSQRSHHSGDKEQPTGCSDSCTKQ